MSARRIRLRLRPRKPSPADAPDSIVIIGAGPAGLVAAQTLRREGYSGPVRLFGAEKTPPVDRPNLSKDYLAGKAPEDWIPLRPPEFYEEQKLELRTGVAATAVDAKQRRVSLDDGSSISFGALLLATGAEPVRLDIPGGSLPHVHYLRTLADSRAIIAAAGSARRVVVVGAGFIGLEVAASLRERGLEVHVVTPDARPLERITRRRGRRLRPRAPRVARRRFPLRPEDLRHRRSRGRARERRFAARGPRRRRHRRPSLHLARGEGGPPGRPGDRGGRLLRDERKGHLRRRRRRPVSGLPHRPARPHRALRGGGAPGSGGRAQHARYGSSRAIPSRPVLLEPALRRGTELRRPRRAVGLDRPGRNLRVGQLPS